MVLTEGEVDESSLNFRRHLLSAAAWAGEKSLVVKLVEEGCNYFDNPGMFVAPLCAASYRGHVEIVKVLTLDDSGDAPEIYIRPELILDFAMVNHPEMLDLALDPSWHRDHISPEEILQLQSHALYTTRHLGTFIRLLEDAKPHMAKSRSMWLRTRMTLAVRNGQANIARHLIENEEALVNEDGVNDESLFQSRCPADIVKRGKFRSRDYTLLSNAARDGHVNVVKILLDAGAKHDHAIEFAAMCGSRTLVRLLWEHGENKDDAVQEAFVLTVDREYTAMFSLLEEMGAELGDDVRVASRVYD